MHSGGSATSGARTMNDHCRFGRRDSILDRPGLTLRWAAHGRKPIDAGGDAMPMHDWSRVEPTIYHDFHQQWSVAICNALNAGLLPPGLSALIEQHAVGPVPEVLAIERRHPGHQGIARGIAMAPRTRMRIEPRGETLLRRANRVAIRHRLGETV